MRSVVIDASVVVPLLIDMPASDLVQVHWTRWLTAHVRLQAPSLLPYEVTSGLHRAYARKLITLEELTSSLPLLINMPVRYYEALSLVERAAEIARILQVSKAYDAFYVALAERLQCECWTGELRLYHNARERGLTFVQSILESAI